MAAIDQFDVHPMSPASVGNQYIAVIYTGKRRSPAVSSRRLPCQEGHRERRVSDNDADCCRHTWHRRDLHIGGEPLPWASRGPDRRGLDIHFGIVPHIVAAITGLAALSHTGALAFQGLKYLGVAYLLYRAWVTLKEKDALVVKGETAPDHRRRSSFPAS